MTSDTPPERNSRLALAGDACLLTAAAFSLLTAIAGALVLTGVAPPIGSAPPTAVGVILSILLLVLSFGGEVVGPVAAWLLHGRRISGVAVLGAVLGFIAGGIAVQGVVVVAMLSGQLTKLVMGTELVGPGAVLAIVVAAFVALVVWLDIDAVRDLSPARSLHRRLDIVRIASTVVVVLLMGAIIGVSIANPKTEIGEAAIFALAGGIFAAVLTSVAAAMVDFADKRRAGDVDTGGEASRPG